MSFFNFIRNAEGGDDLFIDGEIASEYSWWSTGGEVIARRFRQRLSQCGDVTVYINSPGGDVFAGAEIYTALREHKGKVVVKVSGIAASAASLIAMAGDEVLMSPVAYMMIHDPWTYAMGNAREMEKQAAVLREIGEGLVVAYTTKSGKSRDEITEMLADETYMNAQRCVDEGFADGILYEDGAAQSAVPARASTAMRASRYGQAAVCAMIRQPDGLGSSFMRGNEAGLPAPTNPAITKAVGRMVSDAEAELKEKAERAEIAERAQVLAALYI